MHPVAIGTASASISAGSEPPDFEADLKGPMLMLNTYLKQVPLVIKRHVSRIVSDAATLAHLNLVGEAETDKKHQTFPRDRPI